MNSQRTSIQLLLNAIAKVNRNSGIAQGEYGKGSGDAHDRRYVSGDKLPFFAGQPTLLVHKLITS
jgi:hypothetical protein